MTDMETENLIKTLSDGSVPVVRLAQPARRMIVWFMGALIYGAMVAFFMGLRDDLPMRIAEPRFVIELAAALLTSMMAAAAAFCAGCPGRPLWERFAPLPFLGLWLATLGQGCWQDWLWLGAEGLRIGSDFICLPIIAAISGLPGAVMLLMIRSGAPLAPISTVALGALASAAMAATVLRLTHLPGASVMVLTWQFGSMLLLTAAAALFGRQLLRWPRLGRVA